MFKLSFDREVDTIVMKARYDLQVLKIQTLHRFDNIVWAIENDFPIALLRGGNPPSSPNPEKWPYTIPL